MSVNIDRPVGRRMVRKARSIKTRGSFFSVLMIGGMTVWALYSPYSPLALQRPVAEETPHAVVLPNKTADHFRRSEEHLPTIETSLALIQQRGKQNHVPEVVGIEGGKKFQPMLDANQRWELQIASMKQLESDRNAWLIAQRQAHWLKNTSAKTLASSPSTPSVSRGVNSARTHVTLVQPHPNAHQVLGEHDVVADKPKLATTAIATPKPVPPNPSVKVARLPAELQNFAPTRRRPTQGTSGAAIEATDVPRLLLGTENAVLRPWESGQY